MTTATMDKNKSRQEQSPTAPPSTSTEMTLADPAAIAGANQLDLVISSCSQQLATTQMGSVVQGLVRAGAIEQLRKFLTPALMKPIMNLMNSKLGFLTDRGPGKKEEKPY